MDVKVLYFSPVGTVEKMSVRLGTSLAKALDGVVEVQSFTLPKERENPLVCQAGQVTILALPVYAGRLPNVLAKFLQLTQAEGALCVPLVVFGNRNFDDALMECKLVLEAAGGTVIGGGAFVAQHSFSKILAVGRPDAEDLAEVDAFAKAIAEKVKRGELTTPDLPGNCPVNPYYTPRDRHGNGIDIRKVTPKVDENCIGCGLCAQRCPMGSIDVNNVHQMTGICIKCCACEKRCPVGARHFDDPGYVYHRTELEEMYARPAKPLWFV